MPSRAVYLKTCANDITSQAKVFCFHDSWNEMSKCLIQHIILYLFGQGLKHIPLQLMTHNGFLDSWLLVAKKLCIYFGSKKGGPLENLNPCF